MKVALRRNKGILEFLGFVDGKGRIRKAKVRKANAGFQVSAYKAFSPSYLMAGSMKEARKIAKRIKSKSGGYVKKVHIRKAK